MLFRQTNIIWVAFCLGVSVLQDYERSTHQRGKAERTPGTHTSPPSLLQELSAVVTHVRVHAHTLLMRHLPLLLLLCAFAVFLVVNKGIVVGACACVFARVECVCV